MEVDRSYHPLDAAFIREQYLPGIVGAHDLAALAARRAPFERVYGYAHLFKLRASDKIDPRPQPARLKDRLRALTGNARAKAHAASGHPGFDTAIYLYGRPLIITEDDPNRITDLLLGLLSETSEDAIVETFRAQLEHFDIDRAAEIAAFVRRRPPQPLPPEKVAKLYGKIFHDRQVLLRDALLSVGRPESIPHGIAKDALEEDPDMDQKTRLDPVVRFAHYAGHGIGLVLAENQPFWCQEGSPLDLAAVVLAVTPDDPATSHEALIEPLYALLPEARPHATLSIKAHYTAGSLAPAERVPSFLEKLRCAKDRVVAEAISAGVESRPELCHQKLVEAFTYAARTGQGIIEACDIRVADQGGMP